MARPIRIEFCGALYHVTSRGDRREAIYEDDADRSRFLEILAQVVADASWVCHAYCLMGNHYHLVIETPDKNLSKGMRQLNGVYTQMSNRRHGRVGHLFQGRYKAVLVDADSYLRELTRYVVLNPVRAGMVAEPAAWRWSSYRATVGMDELPPWLVVDGLLAQFGTHRTQAVQRYAAFVAEGIGGESIWRHLNRQVFLGDDAFVTRMQNAPAALESAKADVNIPRAHRRPPAPPLANIAAAHTSREAAMIAAHASGEYSYQQIAEFFGVHFTTVGRLVRASRQLRRA
ncbi:MAG: transposase [Xanthomonadales bacterium]|nr:transposase [Xanthomonadales bacterium]MDZ4115517.1 transposase [Xanthomonadaceae bacterium]MDZ4378262.1 transposase [Xanthomonadaceae bacterium]